MTTMEEFIAKAAMNMFQNRFCTECRIEHNGRLAYLWSLIAYLKQRGVNTIDTQLVAEQTSRQILPNIRKDRSGHSIIFPGSLKRGNYSTNAIDCGILVDSFFDLIEGFKIGKNYLSAIDNIANTYLVRKISGPKRMHNQYLWAGTGLARWLWYSRENKIVTQNPYCYYEDKIIEMLKSWLRFNVNGYCAYDNTNIYQNGITTYYHSRNIAFCFYIADKLESKTDFLAERLVEAAEFLYAMLNPDGTKNLNLESKRYYFNGLYEVGSHPYDIYVWSRCYQLSAKRKYIEAASKQLRLIMGAQSKDGGIKSQRDVNVRDWQCDIMRNGHLAWLCRVNSDFLTAALEKQDQQLLSEESNTKLIGGRLAVVGRDHELKVLLKKTPMTSYNGGRASGLINKNECNINLILLPLYFSYSAINNPFRAITRFKKPFLFSIKHNFLHAHDYLLKKKDLRGFIILIFGNLLGYIICSLFIKRTEFCLEIQNFQHGINTLSYELEVSDVLGRNREKIGIRTIEWDKDSTTVTDVFHKTKRLRFTRIPYGWTMAGNVNVTKKLKVIIGNRAVYRYRYDD